MFGVMGWAETGGIISFIAVIALYAITLAEPSTPYLTTYSIIDLFTNTTDTVHLGLGYLGFCISLPNQTTISAQGNPTATQTSGSATQTATTSSSACTTFLSFPTDEPTYILNKLIAPQNLTELPSAGYNSSFAVLFETARELRHSAFEPKLLIAAFVLFAVSGLVFCVIIGCHCCCSRKAPGRVTFYSLATVVLGVSVSCILGGGATLALIQGQNLVAQAVAGAGGLSLASTGNSTQSDEERVFVNTGHIQILLCGALTFMGLFILALAITFGRRAAHPQSQYINKRLRWPNPYKRTTNPQLHGSPYELHPYPQQQVGPTHAVGTGTVRRGGHIRGGGRRGGRGKGWIGCLRH